MNIGELIDGRYKIIQLLGKGGFGETYLVENLDQPGSQYAIKRFTFPSINSGFAKAKELFTREGQTLKRLTHEQIPKFFRTLEVNQDFYLIQEYIEGNTLSEEIQPGKQLKENEVRDFLDELLRILDYVHHENIIHRDIKPENIIRRKNDHKLVLIDFGAVKEIVAQTTLQRLPTQVSTLGYTPPEQIAGRPKFNSDIYALGITAIVALTGMEAHDLPYDKDDEVDWQSSATVSHTLASILNKMVRQDYRLRYQSVKEILNDLDHLIAQPIPQSSQNTNTITKLINPDPRSQELSTQMNLFSLLVFVIIIAIFYAAGLSRIINQKPPKQQSFLIEKSFDGKNSGVRSQNIA